MYVRLTPVSFDHEESGGVGMVKVYVRQLNFFIPQKCDGEGERSAEYQRGAAKAAVH